MSSSSRLVPDYTAKVVIVGDAKTGKTSIFNRLPDNCNSYMNDHKPTGSAKSHPFATSVYNKNVQLRIWDLPSDEFFKNLYKDAKVFIIPYDITNRASFGRLPEWIDHVRAAEPNAMIWLVGTKADLENDRAVTAEEANKLANENMTIQSMIFCHETSAKTNPADIKQMFEMVANVAFITYADLKLLNYSDKPSVSPPSWNPFLRIAAMIAVAIVSIINKIKQIFGKTENQSASLPLSSSTLDLLVYDPTSSDEDLHEDETDLELPYESDGEMEPEVRNKHEDENHDVICREFYGKFFTSKPISISQTTSKTNEPNQNNSFNDSYIGSYHSL